MRFFVILFLAACLLASCNIAHETPANDVASSASVIKTTRYDVTQSISLVNEGPEQPEKHNLWVALIGDQPPYQQLLSRDIQPADYLLVNDEFGNQYAEFDLIDMAPGAEEQITIHYQVQVNELAYDLGGCRGELLKDFTAPELHIESQNPQIVALSEALSAATDTVCQQARAFYDYIGQHLVYTYNGNDWGAQAALGPMGADCTEYSSLLIALSRAQGIPARYVEGLLYLGESEPVEARQEHAWAEVYFPGNGWAPVDPTLGRTPLTSATHFAHYTPNHIIVTKGRSPSTLRGASYWSHLYWPGDNTRIHVREAAWTIVPASAGEES
ncbi:MAG: transglutaminase-like domain-containing protein [Candidatus Promineifilaceae bacterium]